MQAHSASLIHEILGLDQPGGVVGVGVSGGVVTGGVVVVGGGNVVVVVVGGGITNPFAQPQRISIGAPSGVPAVEGMASSALRN